jgi:hypothetical protein
MRFVLLLPPLFLCVSLSHLSLSFFSFLSWTAAGSFGESGAVMDYWMPRREEEGAGGMASTGRGGGGFRHGLHGCTFFSVPSRLWPPRCQNRLMFVLILDSTEICFICRQWHLKWSCLLHHLMCSSSRTTAGKEGPKANHFSSLTALLIRDLHVTKRTRKYYGFYDAWLETF